MIKYNLMDIREYVLKLAEVISEVLRVDVEIVDSNLFRIAGTGRYKNKACVSIEGESYVYKKVIETAKKQVIENPGFNKLCSNCPKKNSCIEKFECCTPIIVEGKVIGVLSLICFTENQKKIIINKFKEYEDFLDKMSDLIATKAKENSIESEKNALMKELESTINYIQDNVVVVDNDFKIIFANFKFKELLKLKFNIEDKNLNDIDISISDYGKRITIDNCTQFDLSINDISRKVFGCINEVPSRSGRTSKVIIFRDMKKLHKTIYEHSQVNTVMDFSSIIGNSKELQKAQLKAKKVAAGHASVLITGESGTGKELFARAIHYASPRKDGPFIAINCGAIPDTLLESELFGYVPGAFSGASKNGKIGKFELANNGSIFLDEIGDMPLHLQVKILRVLQDKVVVPIGGNKPVPINVRVISATNKNLEVMVKNDEFREDLYYRLNVIPIEIPPLRKRKEDIPILVQHFLHKYCSYYNIETPIVDEKVLKALEDYYWPGNIRELENTIEYVINIVQYGKSIELNHLPPKILAFKETVNISDELNLENLEKQTILKALKEYGENTEDKRKVAKALGISLSTLYRKLEKYNIGKINSVEK